MPHRILLASQQQEKQQVEEYPYLEWAGHLVPAYTRDNKLLSDKERIEIFQRTEDFLGEDF